MIQGVPQERCAEISPLGESEGSAIDNSDGSQKAENQSTLLPSIPRQTPD